MKQLIELSLVSPLSQETMRVEWIQLEGPKGEFVICFGHAPIISIIESQSVLHYRKESGCDANLQVNGGIISFADNQATIILD